MEEEIWKDIEGYEGFYQVSSHGRVKSLVSNKILTRNENNKEYRKIVLCVNRKKKYFSASRLVANAFIPNPENKQIVDHINGIRYDNRVCNLRWATYSENSRNSKSNDKSSSKYRGVSKYRNKWRVTIDLDKKQYHLGYFSCEKEAALAYNKKAKELFGDFISLNKIEEDIIDDQLYFDF